MSIAKKYVEAPDLEMLDRRMLAPGSPFELVFSDGPAQPLRRFRAGPHTLAELFDGLDRLGERPFIVADADRLSFAEFAKQARRAAGALRRRGLEPGDRMVLALPNGLDWLTVFAGAVLAGVSIVMPPPGVLEEEAERRDAGCVLSVRDPDQWRQWLAAEPRDGAAPSPVVSALEGEAFVAFTSGSSGPPKPVRIDHRGALSGLRNMMLGAALASLRKPRQADLGGRPASPCVLLMAPLLHVSGYGQFLLMALLGGRLVAPARWDAAMIGRAIDDEGVRSLQGLSPEMAHDLLHLPPDRLERLATVNFYGAPPPAVLVERLKAVLPHLEIGSGYGLTETNGAVAVAGEHDLRLRPGAAGRLSPATDVRIVGEDGQELSPGDVGEIWLAGPMLARGYGFRETAGGAFEGPWFRTGDFGRLDADRFLYLAEREGDVIHCGGRRLSCLVLEKAAQSHPAVRDAAAFSLPDPDFGHRPYVAVVLAAGQSEGALRTWLAGSVDVPELVLTPMDRIARTASGKVDRRALARAAVTG